MTAIICLDDRNGMMFNKRRQSRDRLVIADILRLADGGRLFMGLYSRTLFSDLEDGKAEIIVDENFLKLAGRGDFCFVEDKKLGAFLSEIEGLIVYRWNRLYPSDIKLDIPLNSMKLKESLDFKGNSHERITREVYIK